MIPEAYRPNPDRYQSMPYARCGASGLRLPRIALGLWHNFGDARHLDAQRAVLHAAFDAGVTYFDLANNYGPPYGAAEENFGRHLTHSLRRWRDEMIIATKAGYDMWPGPYGDGGSRKYLMASIDQSLTRMGLDYVDIFYSHRYDPNTPLEETMGALADIVRAGKALYVGISNYPAVLTARAAEILRRLGVPLTVHQPRYSMLDRWIERVDPAVVPTDRRSAGVGTDTSADDGGASLIDVLAREGVGAVVYSPLEQGLLTNRYLDGVPEGSRAATSRFLHPEDVGGARIQAVRRLLPIAEARGQSIAELALSWVLREPVVTSALVGASSPEQLLASVRAATASPLSADELVAVEDALGDLPRVRG